MGEKAGGGRLREPGGSLGMSALPPSHEFVPVLLPVMMLFCAVHLPSHRSLLPPPQSRARFPNFRPLPLAGSLLLLTRSPSLPGRDGASPFPNESVMMALSATDCASYHACTSAVPAGAKFARMKASLEASICSFEEGGADSSGWQQKGLCK